MPAVRVCLTGRQVYFNGCERFGESRQQSSIWTEGSLLILVTSYKEAALGCIAMRPSCLLSYLVKKRVMCVSNTGSMWDDTVMVFSHRLQACKVIRRCGGLMSRKQYCANKASPKARKTGEHATAAAHFLWPAGKLWLENPKRNTAEEQDAGKNTGTPCYIVTNPTGASLPHRQTYGAQLACCTSCLKGPGMSMPTLSAGCKRPRAAGSWRSHNQTGTLKADTQDSLPFWQCLARTHDTYAMEPIAGL